MIEFQPNPEFDEALLEAQAHIFGLLDAVHRGEHPGLLVNRVDEVIVDFGAIRELLKPTVPVTQR